MTDINIVNIEGKPFEKLIEVISQGIGTLYRPKAIRKEADAKAYEIKIIEKAKSEALVENSEFEVEIIDRVEKRLIHREYQKQLNIENVARIATEHIIIEKEVSNDKVDNDWITRFFGIIEDVSQEEMQELWGRILAGEVKQPKSFSFRTLEVLKNLSKEEAAAYTKFAQIALHSATDFFIHDIDKGKFLMDNFGITFRDKVLLRDAGLIVNEENLEIIYEPLKPDSLEQTGGIFYGNKGFYINRKPGAPKQVLKVIYFTKAGAELLKLVEPKYNNEYIEKIAAVLKHDKTIIMYGDCIRTENNKFRIVNAKTY